MIFNVSNITWMSTIHPTFIIPHEILCILVELPFFVQNSILAHSLLYDLMFYISVLAIFKNKTPSSETFEFSVYSWEKKPFISYRSSFFMIFWMLLQILLRQRRIILRLPPRINDSGYE